VQAIVASEEPQALRARRGVLTVEHITPNTAHVRGPGVVAALERLGIPRQWSTEARCWAVPMRRVPDLAADCQRRGQLLTVQDVLR